MNILITGGAGFIGSHVTEHYHTQGADVFIVDNLITGNVQNIHSVQSPQLHFFQENICTFDFKKLPKIDLAYHLASPASPIQYKKHPVETLLANGYGTYRVLEAAKSGIIDRVVLASTSEVYGDPLEHPQKETYWGNVNPVGPRACYDEAKRYAETLMMTYHQSFNVPIRIARIFNTYGPQMEVNDGRVVSNFITQALLGKQITIYGSGTQTRSFCYVDDMVKGLVALGETKGIDGQIVNLGNPEEKTMIDLASLIQKETGTSSKITMNAIDKDDPKRRKPDISKATQILGWSPKTSLHDGLKETIAYFKFALAR